MILTSASEKLDWPTDPWNPWPKTALGIHFGFVGVLKGNIGHANRTPKSTAKTGNQNTYCGLVSSTHLLLSVGFKMDFTERGPRVSMCRQAELSND